MPEDAFFRAFEIAQFCLGIHVFLGDVLGGDVLVKYIAEGIEQKHALVKMLGGNAHIERDVAHFQAVRAFLKIRHVTACVAHGFEKGLRSRTGVVHLDRHGGVLDEGNGPAADSPWRPNPRRTRPRLALRFFRALPGVRVRRCQPLRRGPRKRSRLPSR